MHLEKGINRFQRSPPSRGAWIEIPIAKRYSEATTKSPPSRGAWIEMQFWPNKQVTAKMVAPLAGGVD